MPYDSLHECILSTTKINAFDCKYIVFEAKADITDS